MINESLFLFKCHKFYLIGVLLIVPFIVVPSVTSLDLPLTNPSIGNISSSDSIRLHSPLVISVQTVRTYEKDLQISWIEGSPDGYSREILALNGQFPGETIVVRRGDSLRIRLWNRMNESTTIHWHGFHQRNSTEMDGVPGLSQCEIEPNDFYEYFFSTDNQSGTYWYHSHSAMHSGDGLRGVIVVEDPDDPWKQFYDRDEDVLQLSDWYHRPVHQWLKEYLYPGMLDPIPDSALINGIGQFNCSLTKNCSFHRISIRRGQRKRLRIINTSVYARFTFTISNHSMRLIEADGIALDGSQVVQTLRLSPGQRYSVLIEGLTHPSSTSYWISAHIHPFVDYKHQYNSSTQPNVYSILSYEDLSKDVVYPSMDSLNDQQMLINQSIVDGEIFFDHLNLVPHLRVRSKINVGNRTKREIVYNSQHQGADPGYFYFNNETFVHPMNQTLLSMVIHQNRTDEIHWPTLISIQSDDAVDIFVNNIDFASHPFHLHGHNFWIIAQGSSHDLYRNFSSTDLHRIQPIYRDTLTINAFSYALIRFHADNPGIWMLHCHNDWHVQLGMAIVFLESSSSIRQFYRNSKSLQRIPSACSHH